MASDSTRDIPGADAIIPLTGYYQFAAAEEVSQPQVQSRMFLWCKTGKGIIHVNGQPIPMQVNDFCFLPWDRSIVYQADRRDPFMTGGIHIIPFHRRLDKVVFQVAHCAEDGLFNQAGRTDLPLGALDGIRHGSLNEATALHHLAEYIVQRFRERRPVEWEARALAQLLLAQLSCFFHDGQHREMEIPLPLRQMMDFIEKHYNGKIGLEELARISRLSVSAVGRMFQRHLGIAPVAFITRHRIDCAKRLLAGTRIQVAEIGCRVGVDDPYYFSKLFRKTTGVTPLEYRRKCAFL